MPRVRGRNLELAERDELALVSARQLFRRNFRLDVTDNRLDCLADARALGCKPGDKSHVSSSVYYSGGQPLTLAASIRRTRYLRLKY